MKKRNSLIELYRFIFAMNVVKGHGYFPIELAYVGPARISVEFFFVLTGYLLIRSISKYTDGPYVKGLWHFMLAKLKPLAIPVIVALPFNILYEILLSDGSINLWGYLWYVRDMLQFFIVYFTLRYFLKSERAFIACTAVIFSVCAVLHSTETFYSWGIVRAGMGISCGMLLSYIPKLKLKSKILPAALTTVFGIASALILVMYYANDLAVETILDLIIYPGLIYFTFNLNVGSKLLDYLGALSFGLYAFQCVIRPLEVLGVGSVPVYFAIIVGLTLIEDAVKRIARAHKAKLALQTNSSVTSDA